MTPYFYSHPEKFNLRLIPAPPEIDREDVRLTVDLDEDWDHALAIYEALGPEWLDWQRIARLLDHQPALRSRMAVLNRVQSAPGPHRRGVEVLGLRSWADLRPKPKDPRPIAFRAVPAASPRTPGTQATRRKSTFAVRQDVP